MPKHAYWPVIANGRVFRVNDSAARLALNPQDGDIVIQLDTDTLYQWDDSTTAWQIIAGFELFVMKSGDSMSGSLLFASGEGVDSVAGGGTKTLNIGADNANIINIGGAQTTTVNIIGDVINQEVTNSYITDKLFTINSGGGATTGFGVGFEVEENSIITGYVKTSSDRNGWDLLAPNKVGLFKTIHGDEDASISASGLTDARTYTLPDSSGTFALLAAALTAGSLLFADADGLIAQDNSNLFYDSAKSFLGVGVSAAPAARLHVGGTVSASAWTTDGILLRVGGTTLTDTSSSGAVSSVMAASSIGRPTFAASSVTTYALGATLYIAGAPQNGSNATITAPYSLYVAQGVSRFLDSVSVAKSATSAASTDSGLISIATHTLSANNANTLNGVYAEGSLATAGFNATSNR